MVTEAFAKLFRIGAIVLAAVGAAIAIWDEVRRAAE